MQMGSRPDPNERFTHYLDKTFKKTASLLAYTCRSVSYCICCVLYHTELFKETTQTCWRRSRAELISLREQNNLSWVIRLYRINYPGWSTSRWFKTIARCRIPLRKEPWDGISGQCGNSVYMDI